MQRVPPRSLNLGKHSVRHRQDEGREERNSKEVLTSLLCMQSSSAWHLPKCKGVLPSPSLWFGSAPWSRSSWTRKKKKEPHKSIPFAPQVHVAANRLPHGYFCSAHQLPYWDRDRSLHRNAERLSTKPGKCHWSWAPWCEELGRRTHLPLHQYSPRSTGSCSPFSRQTWQALGPELATLTEKEQKRATSQVLNQNKEHPSKSPPQRDRAPPTPTHRCDHCHCRKQSAGLSGLCRLQHRGQFHPPTTAALREPRRRMHVSWRGTWSERGNAICSFRGRYMCCQLPSHLDLNQFPPVP